jgi:hypothetical protein
MRAQLADGEAGFALLWRERRGEHNGGRRDYDEMVEKQE